ncbi:MAG TPA: hypothetical protein VFN35_19585 [Ktedonobacteraceae bacterium]|nr:hypothetical protein [Ktedonobacteraceae bacterium]
MKFRRGEEPHIALCPTLVDTTRTPFAQGDQGFPRSGQVLKHYRQLKRKAGGKFWTQAAFAFAETTRCIFSYERSFLRPVFAEKSENAEAMGSKERG